MEWLKILLYITVVHKINADVLSEKAAFFGEGLNYEENPCVNFPKFAAGDFPPNTTKVWKTKIAAEVLNTSRENEPAPVKKVREIYKKCKSDASLLKTPRIFNSPNKAKIAQQLKDYLDKNDFFDHKVFHQNYIPTLADMFNFGAAYFGEHLLRKRIYIPKPNTSTVDEHEVCRRTVPEAQRDGICKNLVAEIFGVPNAPENFGVVYFPGNAAHRRALILELQKFYESPADPGPFPDCEALIVESFPMIYKKILLDAKMPQNETEAFNEKHMIYATAIVQEYRRLIHFEFVPEEEKKRVDDFLNHLKFELIGHPTFQDDVFAQYFGNIDTESFWTKRHVNSIQPLIKFNVDKNKMAFYTNSLTEHTVFMAQDNNTYIAFGFEAVLPPYYHSEYPPYFVFSNYIFDFFGEYMSQVIHYAYVHYVANYGTGKPFDDEFTHSWSHEQLYFINLAQLIVLQKRQKGEDPFDENDKAWRIFKCTRAFSNAFHCPAGSKYHVTTDCDVLKGNYNWSEELDYYKKNESLVVKH
ncbi:unnamed protein product [Bursaphelenchus xylophilus]|uniref:(pine wood nematode) hypothetical protein n=1 Tax=Bursaphelenchus xylophilus TaxID=6326 RepID=A0A1I7SBR0_BURXY|nr:unnamed protein product [Bursaphelenchus xylophilus]CAG9111196.1 unnamed protein product [Bursaphelenchus xylophilus]